MIFKFFYETQQKIMEKKITTCFWENGMRCNVLMKEYEGLYWTEVDLIEI